jgi:hypothetical protein
VRRRNSAGSSASNKPYDPHIDESVYKYALVFDNYNELLVGLYFIEITYTGATPRSIDYALAIEERMEADDTLRL